MMVDAVADAHRDWLAYRDGVARAMGLPRLTPPGSAKTAIYTAHSGVYGHSNGR
jgi:hypothetical protein